MAVGVSARSACFLLQFDKDLSLSSDCNGAELDMTEEEEDNSSERLTSSDSEVQILTIEHN